MKAVISARLLASKLAQPGTKPFEIRDRDLSGFILRVQPSGTRSYIVQLGRGRRISIGLAGHLTPAQARDRAEKVFGNVAHGQPPLAGLDPDEALTFGQFIESKYKPWAEANRPRSAAYTLVRQKRLFRAWYGCKLAHITAETIEEWKVKRFAEGRSAATVLRDIATLSGVLTRAVRLGKLADNPIRRVDKPKIDRRPQVRYLDQAEERRLREALIARDLAGQQQRQSANQWRIERHREPLPALPHFTDHLTPAVVLSMNTGLRRGELLALAWGDVDLREKIVTVRGQSAKTGDTRHVPLNSEAVETLRRWREQSGESERIFPVTTSFKTAWSALLRDAKITKRFRWHDLRHHFASRLVQASVPLNTVRELLGHGSMTMTLRYAHLAPDQKRDAVAKLVAAATDTKRAASSESLPAAA
jgi:integrase